MPAAKLPKKLHSRLDYLAARVRKIRTVRALSRAAFVLPVAALVCVLADAYLGLPGWLRGGLFVGWLLLGLRELRNVWRARTAPVDLEAVASAVEEEFPRLAERLTTAVELADHADESNGAPALIEEVILDADSRARKLELAAAFPAGGVIASFLTAMALLGAMLAPAFFAPRGGEHLRRFFLPWYAPSKIVPFKIVVTSGDPAVKRGDPVTLAAYTEATKAEAELPAAATLVVSASGKEERLAMASDEANVWYVRRPAAEGDFDYRVEAGGAVSDTHHVTVVEPVTLGSARITVKPPAYAARDQDAPVEGLGELAALEHSAIAFDLRFVPRPKSAVLEFTPEGDKDHKPVKERHQLKVADDGSARVTVPAKSSGTFALTAIGDRDVRSDFPPQPLRVRKDEPPAFPRVAGLGDKPRQVRPTEKLVVDCAVTDDVAVTALVLEWKVNDGPVQSLPLEARELPAAQAEGKVVLALAGKVKAGDRLTCRLAATDNRQLPELDLKPQTAYFPAKDWAEFTIDPAAEPLAEQDIRRRKEEIEAKLKEIAEELKPEWRAANLLQRGTESKKPLDAAAQERLQSLQNDLDSTRAKADELARDVGVTAELARLADDIRRVSDQELRDAEAALARARSDPKAPDLNEQFKKAAESIDEALRRVNDLLKQNEQIAKDRLDKRKLEDLAQEQKDLADKAKAAKPKDASELAKKQKELEDQLAKLREQSEAIKKAADAARGEEAKKLADEAKKVADEMHDLNKALKQADKNSLEDRLAELKKKQDELAKKAKDLAEKTDTSSRIAETPPLKPEDAERAKTSLEEGKLDEAVKDQEKARQELERLARDLEAAVANSRDPREAARQLARLQEDLRNRLAQATMDKPLDKLPAERREALQRQQEAIEQAVGRLKTPPADSAAEVARQRARADTRDAADLLKKGAEKGADRKMQEARESLEQLADKLPTKEQRLAKAREELANLKEKQESIRQQATEAAKAAERQDPDSAATQRDLAKKLGEAARKQAELAEQLNKMDAPGQDRRKEKTADAMQRAAADMTAGRPQDVAASQQAAKRELERMEQALNGQQPADDKVAELAKKQREVAEEAASNARDPDKSAQHDLQKRQGEIARELERLKTPEAATAQAEAADAAKKAEAAGNNADKPDELASKSKEAADKLNQLNEQVNGKESPAEAADRLAKKQKANADQQEKRQDNASTGEARKKAGQELEELKNMRPGPDAQKAKQQAQDALQRAANQLDPAANAKAQREAADALKDLAERLSRDQKAQGEPKTDDAADAADKLAKKQKELAEKTRQEGDQAKQQPGDAGRKAMKDALERATREQRELSKQAGEMPGRDSPKDLQQAQEAMRKAEEELDRENFEGAVQKQKQAADALDRLSRKGQENRDQRAASQTPDLPTKEQAEEARKLAEEQRKLRDEAMKAADELAKEGARKDNPVEELAKQQQEIAKQAEELAKTVADRQGEKADQSKQARQAADAAKQTSNQVRNGDLGQAKQSGEKAAQAMEQMAQDKSGGETGQKAKDLARRQADVNQKLDELSKDPGAARAQQAARQQQLEDQARNVGQKLDELAKQAGAGGEKTKEAADSAKRAGDKMQAGRQAGQRGQREQAGESRDQAAEAMHQAARQAGEAAKEMAGGEKGSGSPRAGQALSKAQDQMGRAGEKLGQGQPGEAGGAMEKAADSLQQAANQLGQGGQGSGQPQPGQGGGGKTPGGNVGGPGGKLDLRQFSEDVAKHTGKAWGELPGEIKTKIIQEMKARYGEDYARNIKLYFEQLAERK